MYQGLPRLVIEYCLRHTVLKRKFWQPDPKECILGVPSWDHGIYLTVAMFERCRFMNCFKTDWCKKLFKIIHFCFSRIAKNLFEYR